MVSRHEGLKWKTPLKYAAKRGKPERLIIVELDNLLSRMCIETVNKSKTLN